MNNSQIGVALKSHLFKGTPIQAALLLCGALDTLHFTLRQKACNRMDVANSRWHSGNRGSDCLTGPSTGIDMFSPLAFTGIGSTWPEKCLSHPYCLCSWSNLCSGNSKCYRFFSATRTSSTVESTTIVGAMNTSLARNFQNYYNVLCPHIDEVRAKVEDVQLEADDVGAKHVWACFLVDLCTAGTVLPGYLRPDFTGAHAVLGCWYWAAFCWVTGARAVFELLSDGIPLVVKLARTARWACFSGVNKL